QTITIGLTGWKKGLYILHLKTDGRVYNQKLIIR
ncbi:MAG TPA: T9SS type A sorting domain-containing protein, partial [Bacteroidetes bacterium]|nr:T9SS type A sorting domain-containing protein [Bacteroidota bacterium]